MANAKASAGQARNACPNEAFFVGTVAEVLEGGAAELSELSTLLAVIRGLIDEKSEFCARRAADLVMLAERRLHEVKAEVVKTAHDCARQARQGGYSHD